MSYFSTEEEARTAANNAVEGWRDCCDPEWPEEVEKVCWGMVIGQSMPALSEDDQYVDYGVREKEEA